MMKFDIYGESHVGKVRDNNEDSIDWYLSEDNSTVLACLADGMGGYNGGEIASQIAVKTVYEEMLSVIKSDSKQIADQLLQDVFVIPAQRANEKIYQQRSMNENLSKMGTTLTAGLAIDNQLALVSVGDSRCYRLHGGCFEQLTKDDSVAQAILDGKDLGVSTDNLQPFRHLLTKALGTEENLELEVNILPIQKGDLFLFCSDGLTNEVSDEEITAVLMSRKPITEKVGKLVDMAIKGGGRDNISIILLESHY